VTDEPHLPGFLVRRGATRGWMVWDRQTKGPAKYEGRTAVELPEDRAREIRDELTLHYIAKDSPTPPRGGGAGALFLAGAGEVAANGRTHSVARRPRCCSHRGI
jgi:hypothetical protein